MTLISSTSSSKIQSFLTCQHKLTLIQKLFVEFFNMKLNLFTSLLLIIIVITYQNCVKSQPPPDAFSLRIRVGSGEIMIINLQRVESVLAFSNLPVKITLDNEAKKYGDIGKDTMLTVGNFSMYHDYCTKSAFVYFEKTGKLNGVIRNEFSVKGLPMKRANCLLKVKSKYVHIFQPKRYVKKSRFRRSIEYNSTIIRSRRQLGEMQQTVFYPELLVAVSHNMHKALGNNYAKTVSHVLTVYNAVDMLFRLLKSVEIKINIATIIIETIKKSWYFIQEEYNIADSKFIDASVNRWISRYFRGKDDQFPRDSYDFIALNTRTRLKHSNGAHALGVAFPAPRDFLYPPNEPEHRHNLAVTDFDGYESYSTIAHELGHIFSAKHDDEMECEVDMIMAEALCSKRKKGRRYCLEWSQKTEQDFSEFFRSRARCNLLNQPRGLIGFRPSMIFSGEEQCQCYGYKSIHPRHTQHSCDEPMMCLDENGAINEAPLPLDGTPCDLDKVCWGKRCVDTVDPTLMIEESRFSQ